MTIKGIDKYIIFNLNYMALTRKQHSENIRKAQNKALAGRKRRISKGKSVTRKVKSAVSKVKGLFKRKKKGVKVHGAKKRVNF